MEDMQRHTRTQTLNVCDFNSHHQSSANLQQAEANEEDYIRCSRCDQQVVGQMYHCPNCAYYAHTNCVTSLQETLFNHPLHPHAPLALSLVEFDSDCYCYGCPKKFVNSFLGYKCTECPRKLDLKCALSGLDGSHLHCHALEFYYINEQQKACNKKGNVQVNVLIEEFQGKRCAFCELPLEGPVNGCEPCNFWIHKGCSSDFQQEIKPPHHLHQADHHLVFLSAPPCLNRCAACGTRVVRNTFHSGECSFDLHHGCAHRKPSLRHELIGEIHHHDLIFIPDPAPFFKCYACEGFSYETPIFRCVECDFSLHKACIQFPSSVKHNSHSCSLHLFEDFPVYKKVVCNICVKDISPNPGAYCCSDCKFFVHLECVSLELEAGNQIKVLGKVVPTEPLVWSQIEDKGKNIDHRIERLHKDIEATVAQLNLEKKIARELGHLKGLMTTEQVQIGQ